MIVIVFNQRQFVTMFSAVTRVQDQCVVISNQTNANTEQLDKHDERITTVETGLVQLKNENVEYAKANDM